MIDRKSQGNSNLEEVTSSRQDKVFTLFHKFASGARGGLGKL